MIKTMEITKEQKSTPEQTNDVLRPLSRQEIYDILDESSRQVQEGNHRPAKEALEELGRNMVFWRRNYETNDKNRS